MDSLKTYYLLIVSNLDSVGFALSQIGLRQIHRPSQTKKKKCLKDSEELFVVNPTWYLNYTTLELEVHHEIFSLVTQMLGLLLERNKILLLFVSLLVMPSKNVSIVY